MEILARGCADGVPSRLYPKTVVVGSAGVLRVPVFDLNMQTRDHDSFAYSNLSKKRELFTQDICVWLHSLSGFVASSGAAATFLN